jgi:hypothetical protein
MRREERPARRQSVKLIHWSISLVLGASFLAIADGAFACAVPRPFDPDRILRQMTAEQIIDRASIIVEGVVAPPDHGADAAASASSSMVVDRVWKGDINRQVIIRYNVVSSDCTHPPPFGTRIRLSTHLIEDGEISYELFDVELPLDHAGLNQALQGYEGMVEDKNP